MAVGGSSVRGIVVRREGFGRRAGRSLRVRRGRVDRPSRKEGHPVRPRGSGCCAGSVPRCLSSRYGRMGDLHPRPPVESRRTVRRPRGSAVVRAFLLSGNRAARRVRDPWIFCGGLRNGNRHPPAMGRGSGHRLVRDRVLAGVAQSAHQGVCSLRLAARASSRGHNGGTGR